MLAVRTSEGRAMKRFGEIMVTPVVEAERIRLGFAAD